MDIAIIGAGRVGTALGSALEAKAHRIVYGVRDPKRSQERNAATVADALAGAKIVILATPWPVTESLVCEQAWSLSGKVVVDATNPIAANLAGLAIGFDSSGAELLQSQAHEAKFFKAFNTVGVDVMAKPRFPEGRAAMFVAGPDGPEKQVVMSLVGDVGFEAVDAGPLKSARLLEPLAMLWIQVARKEQNPNFALVVGKRAAGGQAQPLTQLKAVAGSFSPDR